jgi:hypothetical protein
MNPPGTWPVTPLATFLKKTAILSTVWEEFGAKVLKTLELYILACKPGLPAGHAKFVFLP